MFLRELPELTVADVTEQLNVEIDTWQGPSSAVQVSLTSDTPAIRFGITGEPTTEVPVTSDGLTALANFLDVPAKFLLRLPADEREYILTRHLNRASTALALGYTSDGVAEVLKPSQRRIHPRSLGQIAGRVISPEAEIVQWLNTSEEVRLDVVVPANFDRGIGGDPQVNDITKGGIRIGQDRKHNLAPYVQPFLFRLFCTNGMETTEDGLKFDTRGSTVEEVLAELEDAAQRAFGMVEDKIAAYYDLRNVTVPNPERTLRRMAEEQGLPDRAITALIRRIPAEIEGDEATQFDLVNLITNAANDPAIASRTAVRREFEVVGGNLTNEHAVRCSHCQQKV